MNDIELLVEALEEFMDAKKDVGLYPECYATGLGLESARQDLVKFFERVLE